MKNKISLIMAAALLCASVFTASAQVEAKTVFAGQGTALSTTTNFFVVSANGVGAPVVNYFNVTGDASPSVLYFYTTSAPTIATAASSGTTITAVGTGYAQYDIIVIQHRATDTYTRRYVSSSTASTIVINSAATVAAGDIVWLCTRAGSIPVGSGESELAAAGGIFAGQRGRPMVVHIEGTNSPTINAISGVYVK